MKEREFILALYEIYKELLSDRERDYFENYYYEDYNLQEIADNYEVSKSYVGKYINEIEDKLKKYETALKLHEKNNKIRSLIEDIDDEVLKFKIEELL
jgi:predicted DNA-binding protein YlxM (UPF0122 family)